MIGGLAITHSHYIGASHCIVHSRSKTVIYLDAPFLAAAAAILAVLANATLLRNVALAYFAATDPLAPTAVVSRPALDEAQVSICYSYLPGLICERAWGTKA